MTFDTILAYGDGEMERCRSFADNFASRLWTARDDFKGHLPSLGGLPRGGHRSRAAPSHRHRRLSEGAWQRDGVAHRSLSMPASGRTAGNG